ncbi:MAG: 2-amino-4-hydroxy-6-hydroxymethyldihydropteridine diphosphokinase [Elusimicrobiota bacterium]|jgi:2-amino-4-hydroxy-6-hydroxymethyldihydropteridine diphosphokinase
MSGTEAFIGIGSNVGPEENIPRAVAALAVELRLTGLSTFYRTAPVGPAGQPAFVNGVARVRTELSPRDLKSRVLRGIETRLGRVRDEDRYRPRPIDLDLLLCGDEVVREEGLSLPDPDLRERPYLAAALLELSPDLRLPDDGKALARLIGEREREVLEPLPEFSKRLKDRFGV